NDENPLVFADPNRADGPQYFDFVSNNLPNIGHLDEALSTADSLFLADISSTGDIFGSSGPGQGVIYQVQVNQTLTILQANQSIYSPNGQYQLIMQGDGNLVEYGPGGQVIWHAGTNGNPGAYAIMQSDGNLVVYSSDGTLLWWSGTNGDAGAYFQLQDNG